MSNYFLAGVAEVDIFEADQLFAKAKTLLDTSITIDVSETDVRGGQGNKLFGKYFHTSKFDAKLTDTMFKIEYMAKNVGSVITIGGDVYTSEQVTLGVGGTGSVVGVPAAFASFGTIGWAKKPTDASYQTVEFTGSDFTFVGGSSGDVVCVEFVTLDNAARQIVVPSNIIPSTVRLVMKAQLFSGDSNDISSASLVGYAFIEVPSFILSGKQTITMAANGVSNTPLEGSALSVNSADCIGAGYYAIITEQIIGSTWYSDVTVLAIEGGEVDLAVAGNETLSVLALHPNALPSKAPNADLTFGTSDALVATVGLNTGVVTGVGAGTCTITVSITSKPTVESFVEVTVV